MKTNVPCAGLGQLHTPRGTASHSRLPLTDTQSVTTDLRHLMFGHDAVQARSIS